MDQQHLFEPIPHDKYDLLSRDELVGLSRDQADLIKQMQRALKEAHNKILAGEQKSFILGEQLFTIKNKLFGKSSEKSNKSKGSKKGKGAKSSKKRVRLPSERYSNLEVIEKDVEFDELPSCPCCSAKMKDSGLFETNEYLTYIPRQYYIAREKKHKYNCPSCMEGLVTTPAIPRVIPGGAYSDEMIIDVAMSKYLDLLPIERYTHIASREGLEGLPANSLINTTHKLADFLELIHEKIKKEVFGSKIIYADETPHRMLEGDKKSNWYTWGFSNGSASFFDIRDTRSGDVASDLLEGSDCEYLVSDVYSGYAKAVREANEKRDLKIKHLYCNAHARRKFKDCEKNFEEEVKLFLKCYEKIYRLESKELESKLSPKRKREYQRLYMRVMHRRALELQSKHSGLISLTKACAYFTKNYESLVRFTTDLSLPLDNNAQERELRSPVIGRKTWYGTHSKRGAKTTAMLFTIVQSCKLNGLNPREYVRDVVRLLHQNLEAPSPSEYKKRK